MLKELADKQKSGLPAVFKGGTALYKALKTTNRFSEDIDLTVDTRGCSRSQNDKRLKQAAKEYSSLIRDPAAGSTNRSEVVSIFRYSPVSEYDENDALQRFGVLKIEATSFTISEPTTDLEIVPLLYELATDEEKRALEDRFKVSPFFVRTSTIERIFIDKIFAAESYIRRSHEPHRAFEAAKHIYDLAIMREQSSIQNLLKDEQLLKMLLDIRIKEEINRLDGVAGVMPKNFLLANNLSENKLLREAYGVMQSQYVLKHEDLIDFDIAVLVVKDIMSQLMKAKAWIMYEPNEELKLLIHKARNKQSSIESKKQERGKHF